MGTWLCCYVNSFDDEATDISFDNENYNADKVSELPEKYNTPTTVFETGTSDNGDKAIMFDVQAFTGQVTGYFVNAGTGGLPYQSVSVYCEMVGGHPKPPNK